MIKKSLLFVILPLVLLSDSSKDTLSDEEWFGIANSAIESTPTSNNALPKRRARLSEDTSIQSSEVSKLSDINIEDDKQWQEIKNQLQSPTITSGNTIVCDTSEKRGIEGLTLSQALNIMKNNNLEIKISRFNEQMKAFENKIANGHRYGKLDITFKAARSNDAGNVFGFKLKSREATFGDFGAEEFMNNMGAAQEGDMAAAGRMYADPPDKLNYPETRNHFQTTLNYLVPLYTGGKLDQYDKITKAMHRMSKLDTSKLINEKNFQVAKTFFDISLVDQYLLNLGNIISNIDRLQEIVTAMKEEGFAKNLDELEVAARKAEAVSMLNQASYNKQLAYHYLSFLLNQDVKSIEVVPEKAPMPIINEEKIYDNNIDIQKAKLGLDITKMAIKLQEANYLPEVGAMAEYGSADNNPFNDFLDKDFYTIGLQAQWNLYNGGIDKNNIEKSKIENMKVQEQVNLAKQGIRLQVRKLVTEIKGKDAQIKSLETQLLFATKVYETYQERYKEGLSSISEVLIKQSKEIEILLKLLTEKNVRNSKVFKLDSIIEKGENI
ncbi:MAG: TolC family protein [Sulfurovum sp.]|nr:MAG: TolC family protein [Sulfurovum sp.]